jgi:hypothetical protein
MGIRHRAQGEWIRILLYALCPLPYELCAMPIHSQFDIRGQKTDDGYQRTEY